MCAWYFIVFSVLNNIFSLFMNENTSYFIFIYTNLKMFVVFQVHMHRKQKTEMKVEVTKVAHWFQVLGCLSSCLLRHLHCYKCSRQFYDGHLENDAMMMYTNDDVHKWWCTRMMMYTNDDVHEWWCTRMMMYTNDDVHEWCVQFLMLTHRNVCTIT